MQACEDRAGGGDGGHHSACLTESAGVGNARRQIAVNSTAAQRALWVGKDALDVREFFLDPKLALLEGLDGREVRQGAVQFLFDLPLKAGVLELQGADVRCFHRRFSFGWSAREWASTLAADRLCRLSPQRLTVAIVMEAH